MHPKEMYNKAMVAASVAEAEGYEGTREGLLEIAKWLLADVERAKEPTEPDTGSKRD